MSSPSYPRRLDRRQVAVGLAVGALSLGLGGCLRPLYGPTASGARLQDVLAEVEVEPVRTPLNQERISHYLRSELIFNLDGSGQPRPKRFKLAVRVAETVQTPIVDTVTGRANSATLLANASFTLTSTTDGKLILSDQVSGTASYDRFVQRFANIRASREAEIRLGKMLAEQIKIKLALALSSS